MKEAIMDVPIIRLTNEEDNEVILLIEPHLECYNLAPNDSVDVYYLYKPDNTTVEKILQVAYRKNEIVLYPPGELSPVIKRGSIVLEPWIA